MQTDILLECWRRRRHGRIYPGRADLDPQKFATLMPWVYLLDIEDGGRIFRFRLVGRRLAQQFGGDYLGAPLDDIKHAGTRIFLSERCASVCRTGEPLFEKHQFQHPDGRLGIIESVTLPLASDGRQIDQLLGALVHRPDGNPPHGIGKMRD